MYKYTLLILFVTIYSGFFVECAVSGRNFGTKITGGRTYLTGEQENLNNKLQKNLSTGLSAWGIITIILLIIFLGAGAYYGIICYPLCKGDNYAIMEASSTNTTPTPTISGEFEKHGNYSSRSTTPRSHE